MSNRPITSREYKVMLNTDRFKNRTKGSGEFMALVAALIEEQGGEASVEFEKKKRQVWYLDTPAFALRQNGFVLRQRQEMEAEKKFKLTLKYRHSDRYLAANAKVSVSAEAEDKHMEDEGDIETKFEEDIIRSSVSKFSHSTSIRTVDLPELASLADAMAIFPGLEAVPNPDNTPLVKVNGFAAHEIKLESGKIDFGEKPKVKPCLSFWYLSDEQNGYPLVAEFSFDYEVLDDERKRLKKNPDLLGNFPMPVVNKANGFFKTLQGHVKWLDLEGSTKTASAFSI